ncbi:hypothetical protein [Xanthomonas translucens]|uniref:hypothetical protein n=1 Tax=Xanthomonas campestris pv. translucens TaxID=343 RepID=UPI000AE42BC9|nr:hypothetical protein [Xanthomonas translucens]MBC3970907.1 hypothetical protein [Xanthomonas translucens pv. undulosa]MCT8271245.1 hypothetical protein [Xanthomonas translucens pv. undulosa]MCT8282940.1 hypothetical protein [Xanthomonas translucens pv. undulosa]MCT8317649.1 hypothetical protein [Xanthomonas translucens pv. undulosa]QSQ43175.1 hypothetical protein ISN33_08820 [Xanthomonas translucens pv. translucens]
MLEMLHAWYLINYMPFWAGDKNAAEPGLMSMWVLVHALSIFAKSDGAHFYLLMEAR